MNDQRLDVTVQGDEGSTRLDRVLAVRRPALSRSRLKALILAGQVTITRSSQDPTPVRDPAYHVAAGDTITIDVPPAVAPEPEGEDIALDIVFEDEDIIVINKPKGLVVHPAAGHETGTLVNALIAHCGASASPGSAASAAGHRAPAGQGHHRPDGGRQERRGRMRR